MTPYYAEAYAHEIGMIRALLHGGGWRSTIQIGAHVGMEREPARVLLHLMLADGVLTMERRKGGAWWSLSAPAALAAARTPPTEGWVAVDRTVLAALGEAPTLSPDVARAAGVSCAQALASLRRLAGRSLARRTALGWVCV